MRSFSRLCFAHRICNKRGLNNECVLEYIIGETILSTQLDPSNPLIASGSTRQVGRPEMSLQKMATDVNCTRKNIEKF